MKNVLLIFILFFSLNQKSISQNIYGFAENNFVSFDLTTQSRDTLIEFDDTPAIILGFRSTIDRFNGRYFFAGSLPGYSGNFHMINLTDLSIESSSIDPDDYIEYDPIRNRIVYRKGISFYELHLTDMQLNEIGEIEVGNAGIYSKTRTYLPLSNQYFYIYPVLGNPFDMSYYMLIDANTSEVICSELIENTNYIYYSPGGVVSDIFNENIIGHKDGRVGIVDPCNGEMSKLTQIPDYFTLLNNQMASYNHSNETYIIPYRSNDVNDTFKIAVVDVYNDEILETYSQPWGGHLNLQQIYDQPPFAPMVFKNDTLFAASGLHYKWFLNNEFIEESNDNFHIPLESGNYKVEVEFEEYSTFSNELMIVLTSYESIKESEIKIYPNPVSNFFHIYNPNESEVKNFHLLDISGRIIQEKLSFVETVASTLTIHIPDLPKGIYVLKVELKNNRVLIEKIIIN